MTNNLQFRRLRLKNWKNFQDVDFAIAERMFLVGPNASGKSNLLDVFRFLCDLASPGGGFQEAVRRRGGLSAIRCLAVRRYPDVEIHVDLQEENGGACWQYELAFHRDQQRRPLVRRERMLQNGETIIDRPDEEDRKDAARLSQTYLEQVNANRQFRGLTDFFASIRYLHIVPQLVRDPDRSTGRSNDPYGGDFLERIARTPQKTRNARLRRIRNALRAAVPQIEEIALTLGGGGTPGRFPRKLSDGTLRLTGLLWAALEKRGPLLLKEPELSLHPEIVRVIPQMLARAQRKSGRQIFLSTYSPGLLEDDGIGLDETLLLFPGADGAAVAPAASLDDIRPLLAGGLSLADVVIPRTRPQGVEQLAWFADA